MLDLTALIDEATRNEAVDESAKLVISKLLDEVEANKADADAIQAVVDRFRASTDGLATAVANVPTA